MDEDFQSNNSLIPWITLELSESVDVFIVVFHFFRTKLIYDGGSFPIIE